MNIHLRHALISVSDELVRCEFKDGSFSELDITQSHNQQYRETAFFWGYDDHVLYAKHHDTLHCWLWEELHDRPSPTLWAAAHNLPAPHQNRDEEHLVNTTQLALSQRREAQYASFFQYHMGATEWAAVLDDARTFLASVGLPFED